MFVYTKGTPKKKLSNYKAVKVIAYEVKWYELPFILIIENFNIEKITLN